MGAAATTHDELKALREEVDTLKALVEATQAPGDSGEDYAERLKLYGFMDMGFQRLWYSDQAAILGLGSPRAATFVLGNVNVYLDVNPVKGFRGLTEVRFTNYPDGAWNIEELRQQQAVGTTVQDLTGPDPGWNWVSWGSIVLEQAWIEGSVTDWFSVKLGSWLTPFGIWNIDHGSPSVIALSRPQFTRGRFYPERQTGLQIIGRITEAPWTFGYTAYVSNGKTSGQLDPTDDKAYGVRLTLETTRPFPLKLGVAGYTGRYSEVSLAPDPTELIKTIETEEIAYRQYDGGVDASIDIDEFRFRAEFGVERVVYDPGKRASLFGVQGLSWPDQTRWGLYAVAAYRLPWAGLEPYGSFEMFRFPTLVGEAMAAPGVGVNVYFSPEVQLKTQFSRMNFFDFDGDHDHSEENISLLASRLVLAY